MGFISNIFGSKAEANASAEFEVSLHCGKCVKRVEDLMAADKAVVSTSVDLPSKTVSVRYDKNKTDEQKLKKSIESLGFDVLKK